MREVSISENYEGEITPIHSNISRFSRGTDPRASPPTCGLPKERAASLAPRLGLQGSTGSKTGGY